jgi:hypothetical protein
MNKANKARRNAEALALEIMLRERSRSNASGVHADKRSKRARTRLANKSKSIREFD